MTFNLTENRPRGEDNPCSVFTLKQVTQGRLFRRLGWSIKEICKTLRILKKHHGPFTAAINGHNFSWLDDPPPVKKWTAHRHFLEHERREMASLFAAGLTTYDIAETYECAQGTVWAAVNDYVPTSHPLRRGKRGAWKPEYSDGKGYERRRTDRA